MKSLISLWAFILLPAFLFGQESLDQRLQIFESEVDSFIQKSFNYRDDSWNLSSTQQEERIQELISISNRIAHIYFSSLHLDENQELNMSLKQSLLDYEEIRPFFMLIGNRFLSEAQDLLLKQEQINRRYRSISTLAGTVIGLASGGALIYFKASFTQTGLQKVTTLALLGAGGAALGYFGGKALRGYILPTDPDVLTAKDFIQKYPEGEDFIDRLSIYEIDIDETLREIEGALNADL